MGYRLGEILIKKGFITGEQLDSILKKEPPSEEILGVELIKAGYLNDGQLLQGVAEQMGLPFCSNLRETAIAPEVVKAVPTSFVQRYGFMPLRLENKTLTIAVHNPMDVWLSEDIKLHLGFQVQRVLCTKAEIDDAIRGHYGLVSGTVNQILAESSQEQKTQSQGDVEDIEKTAGASVIKLVNQILSEAIQMNATDIHLELYQHKVHLRYRVDGVLQEMKVPEDIYFIEPAIVSRIKVMAHLDLVEHRVPQDGRVKVRLQGGQEVDLRISIIPAYFGENVVIRILPTGVMLDMTRIGFSPDDLARIGKVLQKPHGIILLTGPTGSGKTTTLYSCLSSLNKPQTKIISIEDPVEYALEGITQIQVQPKVGLTFAGALRSVLRHDPDIMMIGEIRDPETADLAIRSSLTGHLVFSTLHTNDAPSAISRLIDMGIEPFLLASSLEVIIAQRLVRLFCAQCKGAGCGACHNSGFKGRSAIYEILVVDDQIRKMVLARASASDLKKQARAAGMKTLRDNGMLLVARGLTSEQEITRVVELEE